MANYCEFESDATSNTEDLSTNQKRSLPTDQVQILFFTDPICSHCWAMEPAWRKFQYHYGKHFSFKYVYGGLLPSWDGFADSGSGITKPSDVYSHWKEVAEHSGQPIDPSVWIRDPLHSSFPPSEAAHSVRSVSPHLEDAFLRRIRQALFLESKNIARTEVLTECAKEVGLDPNAFQLRFESGQGKMELTQDIQDCHKYRIFGFPTLAFISADMKMIILRGAQPFHQLEQTLLKSGQLKQNKNPNGIDDVLTHYRTGTTRELSEILELSQKDTLAELTRRNINKVSIAGDSLWIF